MDVGLVNTAEILKAAHSERYAIPAFNIVDQLTMEAAIKAAANLFSPVIIQTSSGTVKRYGADNLVWNARFLARRYGVSAALHLDHGRQPDLIRTCIEAGYSSVMIDGSHLPFEDNVAITRQIVAMAHYYGLSVEGEIGSVGGKEEEICAGEMQYTTPEEALRFQQETGVDFLAVGIGTVHGFYAGQPRVNVEILRAIRSVAHFPLVIHGGTGLPDDLVRRLVMAGGAKFNVSTQVKQTYQAALSDYLGAEHALDPMKMLAAAQDALITMMEGYIRLLGSDEKARLAVWDAFNEPVSL